jgi:hypothetical protein
MKTPPNSGRQRSVFSEFRLVSLNVWRSPGQLGH